VRAGSLSILYFLSTACTLFQTASGTKDRHKRKRMVRSPSLVRNYVHVPLFVLGITGRRERRREGEPKKKTWVVAVCCLLMHLPRPTSMRKRQQSCHVMRLHVAPMHGLGAQVRLFETANHLVALCESARARERAAAVGLMDCEYPRSCVPCSLWNGPEFDRREGCWHDQSTWTLGAQQLHLW
jgi:hypothetical protein